MQLGVKMQSQTNESRIDLTEFSTTLPDRPEREIFLDSTVIAFERRFGPKNEVMLLVGSVGSGKTTHLAQFVRQYPAQCFSYFIHDNIWLLRQSDLLYSLCSQMNAALGNQPIDDLLDLDRLKTLFGNLCQKTIEKAKRSNTRYFFVIDGLDYSLSGTPGERIVDLLPLRTHSQCLYFFGSIRTDSAHVIAFDFHKEEPHLFALHETQTYLTHPGISQDEKKKIHSLSGGTPGYLAVLQTLASRGESLTEILLSPARIEDLVGAQWKSAGIEDDRLRTLIYGLIAFSLEPLTAVQIAQVVDCSKAIVQANLTRAGMINHTPGGEVEFQNELLKRIAREKLQYLKTEILQKLIDFYRQLPDVPKSSVLLPQYLIEIKDYAGVAQMLLPRNLVNSISEQQDLAGARRNLSQACDLAAESNDLIGMMKFGLAVAELRTLSDELIGKSEVTALVALERFEEALDLAYSSRLIPMRIALLSQVYVEMERKGKPIPRESITEIVQMAHQVGRGSEPGELIRLATSLFPLLPDITIELLEQAQLNGRSKSVLDLALTVASIGTDEQPSNEIIDKIQDPNLRELAVSHAPWLAQLSGNDVIEKCAKMESTEAKEYLLRQWALHNRSSDQLHMILDEALDVILSDTDYTVPLRNLRQLAGLLQYCSLEHREALAKRFDVPNFTSLRVPIEERIRLELSLSEALLEVSETQAFERFVDLYTTLEAESETLDLDINCYCYVNVLIALNTLDPKDGFRLKVEVMERVNNLLEQLLQSSADHFEITKKIIRAISAVDPSQGLTFIHKLNTIDRREDAFQELAVAHIRQDRISVDFSVISRCLNAISSQSLRDSTILRLLTVVTRLQGSNTRPAIEFLNSEVHKIVDPLKKSDSLALLIGLLTDPMDGKHRCELFDELQTSRNNVDVLWQRVESAFNQVNYVATSDKDLAGRLYEEAKILRDTSSLANQTIGSMYSRLLEIAARVAGELDFSFDEHRSTWNHMLALIDHIPSSLLRARILARVALARLRNGDKITFDKLMRDQVLETLQSAHHSELYYRVAVNIGAALFEYSRSDARAILNSLPYHFRNTAWVQAAQLTLANACIGDPVDDQSSAFKIDAQIADKMIEICQELQADSAIYLVVNLLTHAIENPDSQLNEAQKLDILVKLDNQIAMKLPDPDNIRHDGYKLVCQGAVERARLKVVKRAKNQIKRQYPRILREVDDIPNIADRALVAAWLAEDINNKEQARQLAEKSLELIQRIPNVVDRINRLEAVASVFSRLNQTTKAQELIRLAMESVRSIEGISREQMLASLIQTAHEIDSEFAAKLTERIESKSDQVFVSEQIRILGLAKSPEKLVTTYSGMPSDVRGLPEAAYRMLKMLVSGRGVLHTDKTLSSSLSSLRLVDFDGAEEIVHWVAETIRRRSSAKTVSADANSIILAALTNATLLYELGNRIAFLSTVPASLRSGFQGLSTKVEVFKAGERDRAVSWIKLWLRDGTRNYVKIYDPYFEVEQLWLLQHIPLDIMVTIGTTWNKIKKPSASSSPTQTESAFRMAWSQRSEHNPPPTLIVIENTEQEPEGHDRFIVTYEGGLKIGTSFNGIGNKEFTISILTPEDAKHVEETYMNPRLDLTQFTRMTFFRL